MDEKERADLRELLDKFENRTFDEDDVSKFLILTRHYVKGKWLKEFANLIAHRVRDKGEVYRMAEYIVLNSRDGQFVSDENNRLVPYAGLCSGTLKNEIRQFAKEHGYALSKDTLNEMELCIFSIVNYSDYKIEGIGEGKIRLFLLRDELWMMLDIYIDGECIGTMGVTKSSVNPVKGNTVGYIKGATKFKRENGKLVMYYQGQKMS